MMLKFVWHRDYIVKTNIFPHENSKTYIMCIYRKRKELIYKLLLSSPKKEMVRGQYDGR